MKNRLMKKIRKRTAKIGIIGLGYVGLPLALAFAESGFQVWGFDVNGKKVKAVNNGKSYISGITDKVLSVFVGGKKRLLATSDFSLLNGMDAICICVPTPLNLYKNPDMSYVISVAKNIKINLRKGQLIVLESTTYPGTTEELLLPLFEGKDKKVKKDFFLAFSPERVDPGNKKFGLKEIPKVVGGVTNICTQIAKELYSQVYDQVVVVSSPRVAEMEKLLENIFRNVNIALVNEIAVLCKKMDIDTREVIDAAKTKPYGFMPFYPGPGIGGHCIPIDPFYLSWKAKEYCVRTRFIELAGEINDAMPDFIVDMTNKALNDSGKCLKDSKILILGVAYKKDINDVRESPALRIISLLKSFGARVFYNDPFVPFIKTGNKTMGSSTISPGFLRKIDAAIIVTDHSGYDYKHISNFINLIVDPKGGVNCEINKKCVLVKL